MSLSQEGADISLARRARLFGSVSVVCHAFQSQRTHLHRMLLAWAAHLSEFKLNGYSSFCVYFSRFLLVLHYINFLFYDLGPPILRPLLDTHSTVTALPFCLLTKTATEALRSSLSLLLAHHNVVAYI